MRRRFWPVLALVMLATAASAQSGFFSGMSSGNFWMEPAADAQGYYYAVRYTGDQPEITADAFGGVLHITVQQALGGPGSFFRSHMSQSFPLAPDADAMRMGRQDAPGRVVFVIPRRMPMGPAWPRW